MTDLCETFYIWILMNMYSCCKVVTWKKDLQTINLKKTYDFSTDLAAVVTTGTSEHNLGLKITSFPTGWDWIAATADDCDPNIWPDFACEWMR